MSEDREGPRRPGRMRAPSITAIGWGFFLGVLVLWMAQNVLRCGPAHPLVGTEAPSFEASIVAGEGQGDRVSLGALRGRVVLLDFWASWCMPCRASIPIVNRLAERYAGAGLVTFGVNIEADRSASVVARAHRALGAGFPTLHDQDWQMQARYDVRSIPALVLIDREGVIRVHESGVPLEPRIAADIEGVLEAGGGAGAAPNAP